MLKYIMFSKRSATDTITAQNYQESKENARNCYNQPGYLMAKIKVSMQVLLNYLTIVDYHALQLEFLSNRK